MAILHSSARPNSTFCRSSGEFCGCATKPIQPKDSLGLLLIRSPKFSRDFGFLWFCSRTKRFYIHPNPNPNDPNHNPEAIHNPNHNPNPNPSPKQSNSCLTSLSRDQNSFLPITLQGSIFTIRHGGDSESAFKNTPIKITYIPLGPFHKNFLKIWASDLVGAILSWVTFVMISKNLRLKYCNFD